MNHSKNKADNGTVVSSQMVGKVRSCRNNRGPRVLLVLPHVSKFLVIRGIRNVWRDQSLGYFPVPPSPLNSRDGKSPGRILTIRMYFLV